MGDVMYCSCYRAVNLPQHCIMVDEWMLEEICTIVTFLQMYFVFMSEKRQLSLFLPLNGFKKSIVLMVTSCMCAL